MCPPIRPASACTYPGCGRRVVVGSRCDRHPRSVEPSGRTNRELYKTAAWRRASLAYRIENPLCVHCLAQGLYRSSEVVDHVEPPAEGDLDAFWDEDNWQALCASCHNRKTRTEMNSQRRDRSD